MSHEPANKRARQSSGGERQDRQEDAPVRLWVGNRREQAMASSGSVGAQSLEGWLRGYQLHRFAAALSEAGCEDAAFLRGMDDEDVAEMCAEAGMKRMQKKRFVKAVQQLRASPRAAPAAPAAAAPAEPAPAAPDGVADGLAPEAKAEEQQETAAETGSSVPVRVWLDVVQPGFGAKFSSAFEAAGLDVLDDLAGTDEGELADLEAELVRVGARRAHLRKIRVAIQSQSGASSTQPNATRPSLREGDRSGKRFAAFLSHHKAAAAMDARFVKDKLEQMLGGGAEVFLDSDNLQDLRLLLDHVRDSDVLVLFQASCPRAGPSRWRCLSIP